MTIISIKLLCIREKAINKAESHKKYKKSSLKMVLYIKDNGVGMSGTAMVFKYGLTELNTKECGKMVKPQEKANLFMLMEMSTMDSGRKTKLAVTECTFTTTEQNTRDNGLKTTSTDTVYKNGWTVVVMKVCTNKAKNMERENTVGETVAIIMETGYKIKS